MAPKIRLIRTGTKGKPRFRIGIQDKKVKRDGKTIEVLGFYDPMLPAKMKINQDRLNWWQEQGAQKSRGVKRLLQK